MGVNSVCVAYFLVKMTRYCLMFWLPFFLVKAAGVDASSAAKLATLLDVGGTPRPRRRALCVCSPTFVVRVSFQKVWVRALRIRPVVDV